MRFAAFLIVLCCATEALAGLPFVQCRMPAGEGAEGAGAPLWVIECARDEFKRRNYCLMQQSGAAHRNAGLSVYRDAAPQAHLMVGSTLLVGEAQVSLQVDEHSPVVQASGRPFRLDGDAALLAQLRQGSWLHAGLHLAGQPVPPEQARLSLAGFAAAYDRMAEAMTRDPGAWPACNGPPAPGSCCQPPP